MNRQVCPLCALEDYLVVLDTDREAGTSDYRCENPTCHRFSWRTTPTTISLDARTGIAAEYGVYDDLLACIGPDEPWLEFGIIEYRYSRLRPDIYTSVFLPRWGYTCQGPRKYSVSSFLGGTAGSLFRSGDLAWRGGPATGYWAYNHGASYYAHPRQLAPAAIMTWEAFAEREDLDPLVWTLPVTGQGANKQPPEN